ncbi:sigma-70 family RNA polymerase sigma factor [Neisseriaceae bacterium TC5R-5]|nr:sigma-70 family RNA polymerase sigma factor [Neisseriaceae bacterium TC5R-5]
MSNPFASEHFARKWRGPMLRFALLHLQPREEAEDAVQDALAAMLTIDMDTLGQTDPRNYLFGILRNKVIDRLRQKYRPEIGYSEAFPDDLDNTLFNDGGHWVDGVAPSTWATPDDRLQTAQFFAVLDLCILKLPPKPARVFSMKELLECESEEICTVLNLSKSDYWQCMSRARKQIQLCLNQNWFERSPP